MKQARLHAVRILQPMQQRRKKKREKTFMNINFGRFQKKAEQRIQMENDIHVIIQSVL